MINMQSCTIVFLSAVLVNLWSMDRHRSLRCGLLVPEIAVRHLVGQFSVVILVPGFKEVNHRFAGPWHKKQSWYRRCVLIIPWICPALSQHPSGLAERPLIDQNTLWKVWVVMCRKCVCGGDITYDWQASARWGSPPHGCPRSPHRDRLTPESLCTLLP